MVGDTEQERNKQSAKAIDLAAIAIRWEVDWYKYFDGWIRLLDFLTSSSSWIVRPRYKNLQTSLHAFLLIPCHRELLSAGGSGVRGPLTSIPEVRESDAVEVQESPRYTGQTNTPCSFCNHSDLIN